MALADLESVKTRMKELRARTSLKQYEVAAKLDVPPRTFQTWENGEVETDKENYEKVAAFYSKVLGEKITANWILFGSDKAPPVKTPANPTNGNGSQLDRIEKKLDTIILRMKAIDEIEALLREISGEEPS